jgi:hypothetical protein
MTIWTEGKYGAPWSYAAHLAMLIHYFSPVNLKIPLEILPDQSMERHTTQSIIDISQKIYEEQVKEFTLSSQRVQYQGKCEGTKQDAMIVDISTRYFQ